MRLITIIGTDITGSKWWWDTHFPEENPPIDGDHHFDRAHRPSMDHQYREIADVAQFDGIAVGLRAFKQPGDEANTRTHFTILRDSIRETKRTARRPAPTIMPWCDTGAMTDYINYGRETNPIKFDFSNPTHIATYWPNVLGPYFETFPEGGNYTNPIKWERTPDGRILIALWGINHDIGYGIVNQHDAQKLLAAIEGEMVQRGIGVPAFIIDTSWPAHITAYAKHGWFDGSGTPYTVVEFNGVKTGVLVAGFQDPWDAPKPWRRIERRNGATYLEGLSYMRNMKADIVLYESYNNRVEGAGIYSNQTWGDLYLDITRAHQQLVSPEQPTPVPLPEPIEPIPSSLPTGEHMIALTEITDAKLYDDLIPGEKPDTFALVVGVEGTRKKLFRLTDTGEVGFRYHDDPDMKMPGAWESGRKIGNKLVFRTNQHVKMFWLTEGL